MFYFFTPLTGLKVDGVGITLGCGARVTNLKIIDFCKFILICAVSPA